MSHSWIRFYWIGIWVGLACTKPSEDDGVVDTQDTRDSSAVVDTQDTQPVDTETDSPPVDTSPVDTGEPDPDPDPDPDPEPEPEPDPLYNLCGEGKTSTRPAGTWSDPVIAEVMVMVDRADTSTSTEDQIDFYDCASSTSESGPEVIYRFEAPSSGTFRAELTDPQGVDIDIHLLQNPSISAGKATGCIARAHEALEVSGLAAGEYWVVADTWSSGSTEYAGSYELAFEFVPDDAWTTIPLTNGLSWERKRDTALAGGDQTVNVLRMDLSAGFDLQPQSHSGCKTVPSVLQNIGAHAGINGGFFGSGCSLLDLFKSDGNLISTNGLHDYQQRSLGWSAPNSATMKWVDRGVDWGGVSNAMGGYPSLVEGGTARAEIYPGEQVWSSTDWSKHPRTAVGLNNSGELLMVTVDGRTAAGDGMTTTELAELMRDLGASEAMNLDGGGSTTMSISDCWINDVVNHPSDNGAADHNGARTVGSGLYVR